jgi:hypothetical protein
MLDSKHGAIHAFSSAYRYEFLAIIAKRRDFQPIVFRRGREKDAAFAG